MQLPAGVIIAAIKRKEEILIPRGNIVLNAGDHVILGAEPFEDHDRISLKEMVLKKQNPWTDELIRNLDISRYSVIVLVKRGNKALIPNGDMRLREGDHVFMYTQLHLADSNDIEI